MGKTTSANLSKGKLIEVGKIMVDPKKNFIIIIMLFNIYNSAL